MLRSLTFVDAGALDLDLEGDDGEAEEGALVFLMPLGLEDF